MGQRSSETTYGPWDNILQEILPPEIMQRRALKRKIRLSIDAREPARYMGVGNTRSGNWSVEVRYLGERVWLGTFQRPEMAALAYDAVAIALPRERAPQLNFPHLKYQLPRPLSLERDDLKAVAKEAASLATPEKFDELILPYESEQLGPWDNIGPLLLQENQLGQETANDIVELTLDDIVIQRN